MSPLIILPLLVVLVLQRMQIQELKARNESLRRWMSRCATQPRDYSREEW